MIHKLPPLRTADDDPFRITPAPVSGRSLGAEPASFLVGVDFLVLALAFSVGYIAAPILKEILLNATAIRSWILVLSPAVVGEFRALSDVLWVLPVMAAVSLLCIQQAGGYRPLVSQTRTQLLLTSMTAPLVGLSVVALVLFTLRSPNWSRLFVFLFTLLAIAGLASYRLVLRWYRSQRIASGFYARNVVLVGPSSALGWLSAHVAEHTSRTEFDVTGYLSVSPAQQAITYKTVAGQIVLPCLGDVTQLPTLLVHRPIHEVIAVQGGASEWLRAVVETCDYFRITLRIVPEALVFGQLRDLQLLYHSDELRLPEIVLRPRHLDSTALFIKRLVDIVGSLILLVLLAPVFVLVAVAIKLTTPRLPIFYRWQVVGCNGRRFTGFKFSTMAKDADQRKSELMSQNQMTGPVFKIRDDPRVTRLGKFLRKFSINELPQLWSVLKGDMSLVGPRPAFPHELERYELWHKRKLTIQPGMTCLWQVQGRNKISRFDDWVRMDLEYIDNWSLWLDFKILARTAWTVVRGSGW